MRLPRPALVLALLVLAATPLAAQQEKAAPSRAPTSAERAAVLKATQRFQDVNVALKEGYVPDPKGMCVTSEMEGAPRQLGAMGVHYFRPDLLGLTGTAPRVDGNGTHTDFDTPGILIYEPEADGSMKLVAIENLVWAKAWEDAGNKTPPEYLGNQYYHMVDNPETPADEAHGFAPHYELHIWTELPNPTGAFMEWNPKATCRYHRASAGSKS